jgi:hypothetical protein
MSQANYFLIAYNASYDRMYKVPLDTMADAVIASPISIVLTNLNSRPARTTEKCPSLEPK